MDVFHYFNVFHVIFFPSCLLKNEKFLFSVSSFHMYIIDMYTYKNIAIKNVGSTVHWRNGVEWLVRFSFQLKRMSKIVMNIVFRVYVWYNSHLMQSRIWRNWIVKKSQFKCKNILQIHRHKISNRTISTINEIHCIDAVVGKFVKSHSFFRRFIRRILCKGYRIIYFPSLFSTSNAWIIFVVFTTIKNGYPHLPVIKMWLFYAWVKA